MLENRIRTAVEFGVQGPERLGQILSRMTPDEREGVLGDLADRDPAATRKVERFLFPFERLVALRPEELQRVITAVPYSTWALALRGASNDFVEGIFAQLPGGAQTIIREGMEAPVGKENVIEARSAVLSQLYRLAAAGQVELHPDSEVSPLE
jgi:flagellar motor switch protein FliG